MTAYVYNTLGNFMHTSILCAYREKKLEGAEVYVHTREELLKRGYGNCPRCFTMSGYQVKED